MNFRNTARNQKGERLGFKGRRSCDQYYQIDYLALKNLRSYDFSQKDLNYDQCAVKCTGIENQSLDTNKKAFLFALLSY